VDSLWTSRRLRIVADCTHATVAIGLLLGFLGIAPFSEGILFVGLVTYAIGAVTIAALILVRAGIGKLRARSSD